MSADTGALSPELQGINRVESLPRIAGDNRAEFVPNLGPNSAIH